MCYHIANTKDKVEDLQQRFTAKFEYTELYEPYYHFNGFEKRFLYIILQESPYTIVPSYWGIMPENIDISERQKFLLKTNTLNATYERLYTSPLYKNHITNNRCLIIADGFYEPHKSSNLKASIPHYFQMKDKQLFAFAGIYNELDDGLFTASIITVEANPFFKKIHNTPNKHGKFRMPLILNEKDENLWLDPNNTKAEIDQLLFSFTNKELVNHSVNRDVFRNKVNSNVLGIIEPVNYFKGNTLFGNDF